MHEGPTARRSIADAPDHDDGQGREAVSTSEGDVGIQEVKNQPGSAAIGMIRAHQGIVRRWVNEGSLSVDDDIIKAPLVAGDVRDSVFAAIRRLVSLIKSEVLSEPKSS